MKYVAFALTFFRPSVSVPAADNPASSALGRAHQVIANDGVIHTDACSIPLSALTSEEARRIATENAATASPTDSNGERSASLTLEAYILKLRQLADDARKKMAQDLVRIYPVTITEQRFAGVSTDVVVPSGGASAANRYRVLINLHGGGMILGAHYEGHVMSIPIASVGRIKVITVGYRVAFQVRRHRSAENACRSGLRELVKLQPSEYLSREPTPGRAAVDADILRAVVFQELGVHLGHVLARPRKAELGRHASHAFMYDSRLPESREVYDLLTKFFDKHLGRNALAPGRRH